VVTLGVEPMQDSQPLLLRAEVGFRVVIGRDSSVDDSHELRAVRQSPDAVEAKPFFLKSDAQFFRPCHRVSLLQDFTLRDCESGSRSG
jgi:hypothetical protein